MNQTKFLNTEELREFKALLKKYQKSDSRNVTMLELALSTGARASEVLNIRFTDLNPNNQTVFIRGLKGSRDREMPVKPELFDRLLTHVPFGISYQRMSQVWDLYKPGFKKLHSLRHTFAIELFKATRDLRLVQLALGHKSITNTMVYSEYLYSREEMKRCLIF